jgi:hypothetical protein
MSIKLKIEKQFLYLVTKALRTKKKERKKDQVLQAIAKKLNNFHLFYSFNLKVKSNKFIYFASLLIQSIITN